MTGLFGTLNTSTSGLRAQQLGLQTTGHNLANINTKGYTRQRVNTSSNLPQNFAGIGQVGTGVVIDNITRITDEFVNSQLQNEEASLERFNEVSQLLGQLEGMFNEPSDTGISHQISKLFSAWDEVANNSGSVSAKSLVISQAETLLDTISHTANNIDKLDRDIVNQIDKEVLDFNSRIEQLESINKQIFNATVKGEHPNDLLDRRDLLVSDLKNIAGVDVKTDKYERAIISFGDTEVLTSSGSFELEITENPDGEPMFTVDGQEIEIDSGRLKGQTEALDMIREKKSDLNAFVNKFATAVNMIYTDTEDAADLENLNEEKLFFVIPTEENKLANGIEVNSALVKDPSKLIVGVADEEGKISTGDGDRAKAIASLKDVLLSGEPTEWKYDSKKMEFTHSEGGATIGDSFTEIVTDLGVQKQKADSMVENQMDLAALLAQRQASVSGVDMNEEVTNMIQFQSAFQANARTISTVSEMLDTLINRMGV